MSKGASDLSTGANTLSTGVNDLSTGADTLSTGASDLSTGADTLGAGASSLNTGVQTLAKGVKDLNTAVNGGETTLAGGASAVSAGVDTLVGKLGDMATTLQTKKDQINANLQANGTSIENAQATIESLKSAQSNLMNGISMYSTDSTGATAIFTQVGQALGGVSINSVNDAMTVAVSLSDKIAKNRSGSGAVSAIDEATSQISDPTTQAQLTALQAGAKQVADGRRRHPVQSVLWLEKWMI